MTLGVFVCALLALIQVITAEVQLQLSYRIEEEVIPGSMVGDIGVDSKLKEEYNEVYDQLRFTILSQTPTLGADSNENLFALDQSKPVLKTLRKIDRDVVCPNQEKCIAEINVKVEPQNYFQIIQIAVEILDLNDNAPRFSEESVQVSLPESSRIGSRISLPVASDNDSPANSIRRYVLTDSSRTFAVEVVNSTDIGVELYLVLQKELDRESKASFSLTLTAYDGFGPTAKSGSTRIEVAVQDVNDHNPVFELSAYEFLLEEPVANGSVIGTLIATDLDAGLNAEVVYSLSGSRIPFWINSSSGELHNTAVLDHEVQDSYVFTVQARDKGENSLPGSARVTVKVTDVNDNPPVIAIQGQVGDSHLVKISEDSNINAFVAHLTVTDEDSDENGQFTCSLSVADFKLVKLFDSQFKVVTAVSLDREQVDQYDVVVRCRDKGSPFKESQISLEVIVVDVNDNAPKFTQHVFLASVLENSPPGTSILTVSASDADAEDNGEVVYALAQEALANFTIDARSGEIQTLVSFDREEMDRIQFRVTAMDLAFTNRLTSTATVILDILDRNDEMPKFLDEEYTFPVYENLAPGVEVGQVLAVDLDEDPYNDFVYSISSMENASAILPFEMDPYTGKIWTTQSLDRETTNEYTLRAYATSIGPHPMYGTTRVVIYVADRNDQPPVLHFPQTYNNTVYIPSLPKNRPVANINASDADIGTNALLSYYLSGADSYIFTVDESTGEIQTRVDLSKHGQGSYHFKVIVRDHGDPPLSAESGISILVNDSIPLISDAAISRQNLTIVIIIVCISAVAIVLLLTGIAAMWFVHRRAAQKHKRLVLSKQLIALSHSGRDRDSLSDRDFKSSSPLETSYELGPASELDSLQAGNLGEFQVRKKSSDRQVKMEGIPRRPPPKPPQMTDDVIAHKPPIAPPRQPAKNLKTGSPDVASDGIDCCSSSDKSDVTDSGRGSSSEDATMNRHKAFSGSQVPLRRISSGDDPSLTPKQNSITSYDLPQGHSMVTPSKHSIHSQSVPSTPHRSFNMSDIPDPIWPTPAATPSPDPKILKRLQMTPRGNYRVDSNLTEHGSYV